jgi:hypothetical protein
LKSPWSEALKLAEGISRERRISDAPFFLWTTASTSVPKKKIKLFLKTGKDLPIYILSRQYVAALAIKSGKELPFN